MSKGEAAGGSAPRMPPAWEYHAMCAVAQPLFRVLFRFRVIGHENIPARGPVVLAAVHRSNSDVPFLAAACSRPIHFMAKAELFRLPLFGRWFGRLGAFPVERGQANKAALSGAGHVLDAGRVLGMFPEGGFGKGPTVGELQRGAAWLALRHRAALVPVAIGGAHDVLPSGSWIVRPARVTVVIGTPVPLPEGRGRSSVAMLTESLHSALQDVYDRATRCS